MLSLWVPPRSLVLLSRVCLECCVPSVEPMWVTWLAVLAVVPTPGYLQFEAYQNIIRKHKHSNHFALLREVPDSEPPRTTQLMDRYVQGVHLKTT
jgi:hypothetical protein